MHTRTLSRLAATAAVALGLAACGGNDAAANAGDSAAAVTAPTDSMGLQTTPPQPGGPMNMVDSASRVLPPDSLHDSTRHGTTGTMPNDSAHRRP